MFLTLFAKVSYSGMMINDDDSSTEEESDLLRVVPTRMSEIVNLFVILYEFLSGNEPQRGFYSLLHSLRRSVHGPSGITTCDSNERAVWCYLGLKLAAVKFGVIEYTSM
jgi:hypothetical protein